MYSYQSYILNISSVCHTKELNYQNGFYLSMATLKTCKLCKRKTEKLINGHIISRSLVEHLSTHDDGKIHLRLSDIPNLSLQDGPKKYMYCPRCDNEILSRIENKFSIDIFQPFYSNIDSVEKSKKVINDNTDLLHKYSMIALLNGLITALSDAGISGTKSTGNMPIKEYKKSIYAAIKDLRKSILSEDNKTSLLDIYSCIYSEYININNKSDIHDNYKYISTCLSIYMGFIALPEIDYCIFGISIGRFSFFIYIKKDKSTSVLDDNTKDLLKYFYFKSADTYSTSISSNMSDTQKNKLLKKEYINFIINKFTI